jgi:hypothetical protein
LFASVTLGKSPVEGVGQGVLAEVAQDLVIELEGGEVCCKNVLADNSDGVSSAEEISVPRHHAGYSRDARMASSEKASMIVAS